MRKADIISWRSILAAFICFISAWGEPSGLISHGVAEIDSGAEKSKTRESYSSASNEVLAPESNTALREPGEPPWMVVSVRTRDNEYYHAITKGAKLFAKSIGAEDRLIFLFSEGSSEKQVVDLIKTLQKTGKNTICYLDPNEAEVAPRLAEICKNKQVYFATQWNIPESVRPWYYDPYWVVHSTPDSEQEGYITARALCLEMNGRGTLLALQGRLGNSSGKGRFKGMMKAVAEFPEIELFNAFVNDWGRIKSIKTTERWLQRLPEIDGVWAACDEMALGALEVFRSAGKAGEVKITGIDATGDAVKAVIAGEMLCTVSPDPYWQSGMSLSFAHQAHLGHLNVTGIPHEKRAFYITSKLINKDNAEEYLEGYVNDMPIYNYKDLWEGKWLAPIGTETN